MSSEVNINVKFVFRGSFLFDIQINSQISDVRDD